MYLTSVAHAEAWFFAFKIRPTVYMTLTSNPSLNLLSMYASRIRLYVHNYKFV